MKKLELDMKHEKTNTMKIKDLANKYIVKLYLHIIIECIK